MQQILAIFTVLLLYIMLTVQFFNIPFIVMLCGAGGFSVVLATMLAVGGSTASLAVGIAFLIVTWRSIQRMRESFRGAEPAAQPVDPAVGEAEQRADTMRKLIEWARQQKFDVLKDQKHKYNPKLKSNYVQLDFLELETLLMGLVPASKHPIGYLFADGAARRLLQQSGNEYFLVCILLHAAANISSRNEDTRITIEHIATAEEELGGRLMSYVSGDALRRCPRELPAAVLVQCVLHGVVLFDDRSDFLSQDPTSTFYWNPLLLSQVTRTTNRPQEPIPESL